MPIPQTTYGQAYAPGFAGLIYDSGFHDTMSYSAEVGAIPFGTPVTLGTNKERQVKPVTTAVGQGALVVGIAAATASAEAAYPAVADAIPAYLVTASVPVFKRGRIWVLTNEPVVAGATANLNLATGKFTDEAVGAGIEAFTQFSAKFITGNTAAGLAVVEIK